MARQESRKCVVVLTGKSAESMQRAGLSGDWRASHGHVETCEFLVTCCNSRAMFQGANPEHAHGEAFMVAPLTGVIDVDGGRVRFTFAESAAISVPNAWQRLAQRNPVAYSTLEDLDIDPDTLSFVPNAPRDRSPSDGVESSGAPTREDILNAAKRAIADAYGVVPDAVTVTVRL